MLVLKLDGFYWNNRLKYECRWIFVKRCNFSWNFIKGYFLLLLLILYINIVF